MSTRRLKRSAPTSVTSTVSDKNNNPSREDDGTNVVVSSSNVQSTTSEQSNVRGGRSTRKRNAVAVNKNLEPEPSVSPPPAKSSRKQQDENDDDDHHQKPQESQPKRTKRTAKAIKENHQTDNNDDNDEPGKLRRSSRATTKASTAASAATASSTKRLEAKKGTKTTVASEKSEPSQPVANKSGRNRKKNTVTETVPEEQEEVEKEEKPAPARSRAKKKKELEEIPEEQEEPKTKTRGKQKTETKATEQPAPARGRTRRKAGATSSEQEPAEVVVDPEPPVVSVAKSSRNRRKTVEEPPQSEKEIESKAKSRSAKNAKTVEEHPPPPVEKSSVVRKSTRATRTAKAAAKIEESKPTKESSDNKTQSEAEPLLDAKPNRRAVRNLAPKLDAVVVSTTTTEEKLVVGNDSKPTKRGGRKKVPPPATVSDVVSEPVSTTAIEPEQAKPMHVEKSETKKDDAEEEEEMPSEPTITEPTDETDEGKETKGEPAVEIESSERPDTRADSGDVDDANDVENQTYVVDEQTREPDVLPNKNNDTPTIEEIIQITEKKTIVDTGEKTINMTSEETIIVTGFDESKFPGMAATENGTAEKDDIKRKIDDITIDTDDSMIPPLKRPRFQCFAGELLTMGDQLSKELGPRQAKFKGEKVKMNQPALVKIGEHRITQVSMGALHTLAVTETGRILSFGCNDDFVLGRNRKPAEINGDDDSDDDEEKWTCRPELVEGIPADEIVVKVSAGDMHSAALTENGNVYIWGNFKDESDKLGLFVNSEKAPESNDFLPTILPRRVDFDKKVVDISSGSHHLLLLTDDGQLYTFGEGSKGQLGRITSSELNMIKSRRELFLSPHQVSIPSKSRVTRIFSRQWNSFAVTEDDKLYGWGLNNYHQLGIKNECISQANSLNSGSLFTLIPTLIPVPFRCVQVASGQQHSLALDDDGNAYSCGSVLYGKLGHGKEFVEQICQQQNDQSISEFKRIDPERFNGEPVVKIDCGDFCSMAVTKSGKLYCWGQGSKCIGTDDNEDLFEPKTVNGAYAYCTKFLTISTGSMMAAMIGQIQHDDNNSEEKTDGQQQQ